MFKAVGEPGNRPQSGAVALRTLTSRTDLPARVRAALDGVLGLCSTGLVNALTTTLDDIEQQLFKLAEQSRNNEQQYRCFETLREIKRGRPDVTPRYMLAIEDLLARVDQRTPSDDNSPARSQRPGAERQELTLVDTSDLEASLALQEFSAKTDIHQAPALYLLGHRFGVLIAAPALDAESLPIGPDRLGRALTYACEELDISADHRVLLFRTFGRIMASTIGAFYNGVNDFFIESGILPNLQAQAPRQKHVGANSAETAAEANTQTSAEATQEPRRASSSTPGMPPSMRRTSPLQESPRSFVPNDSVAAPAESAMHNSPIDERDSELFTTLRELLSGRRHAMGIGDKPSGGGYVPSSDDVQSVLGALQSKPISSMMMGGKLVQRSVGQLKQDLMAHLRQLAPDGKAPQLNEEDSDTIDLVGMLFDYITKNVRPNGSTQSLMTKLQVPLLRVALRDKSFFTRRAHPARQLLNTIAETGVHWLDDSENAADRHLVDKMQMVVDKVNQEFDGDIGLFENMLTGLSEHMRTLARKAEVAERRHVDAARGREKLTVARERASEEISARIARKKPSKLVRTVLEQAWTDVLALTLLREGEDSASYKKRLSVADQLLDADSGREGENKPASELRQEIETGLDQVGYHQDDVQAVVKRLFLPQEAANEENPSSNTEIAIKLKSKARLGDSATQPAAVSEPLRRPKIAADSAQAHMLARLKTLPFGTWFDFQTNQQGDKVHRKLAWFSTLTGRCLFVNQRGVRTDEKTLEQLAHDIVAGHASIVEAETESVVDRAWKAIVASLKQMVGKGPDAVSVPA
ncbi:MAG TPA: DUF1631 domain-containing protein [Rudaea sp.]|nr:DUF1631 domain-containing protein [Rudaea sp.]